MGHAPSRDAGVVQCSPSTTSTTIPTTVSLRTVVKPKPEVVIKLEELAKARTRPSQASVLSRVRSALDAQGGSTAPALVNGNASISDVSVRPKKLGNEEVARLAFEVMRSHCTDSLATQDVLLNSVVRYFDHPSVAVRREAAQTVASLAELSLGRLAKVMPDIAGDYPRNVPVPAFGLRSQELQLHSQELQNMMVLLRRVLGLAVSDPDCGIRLAIFKSLNAHFNPLLAEASCIGMIAQALNDEDLDVRKAAIEIMSRLMLQNPGHVTVALRKVLIEIMTELEYSMEVSHKLAAAEMLSAMSKFGRAFLQPYARSVANCLLRQLQAANADGNLTLSASLVEAVGQLSGVSPNEIKALLDQLLPMLVDMIQDPSGSVMATDNTPFDDPRNRRLGRERRLNALEALQRVVANTGHVIEPYEKYPSLLPFLIDLLRSEVHRGDWPLREQILRCIGTLGALDPTRFEKLSIAAKPEPAAIGDTSSMIKSDPTHQAFSGAAPVSGGVPAVEGSEHMELFATHAISALLKMLQDSSLAEQHAKVITTLMKVIKTLDERCVLPFLPQIVTSFTQAVHTLKETERGVLLGHLTDLVQIAGAQTSEHLDVIFKVISSLWREAASAWLTGGPVASSSSGNLGGAGRTLRTSSSESPAVTLSILNLLEEISRFHQETLRAHLGQLLPTIIGFLQPPSAGIVLQGSQQISIKVLESLVVFGNVLGDFLHLVIPALVRLCEDTRVDIDGTSDIREKAIRALGKLSNTVRFPHLLSRVVHPLLRILDNEKENVAVWRAADETLLQLQSAYGKDFSIFMPRVEGMRARRSTFLQEAYSGSFTETPQSSGELHQTSFMQRLNASDGGSSWTIQAQTSESGAATWNLKALQQAWAVRGLSTKDHWVSWMQRLALELLRESPSPAFRYCSQLAEVHPPLSRELYHASFLACWKKLKDSDQNSLLQSLLTALRSPSFSPDMLQAMLNLAEFMDRSGSALPVEARTWAELSLHCHAYAKALRYKEIAFQTSPDTNLEALISINMQLQDMEAAQGVFVYARKNLNIELQEAYYERLHRWEDALEAYEQRQKEDPTGLEWTKSRMRCLYELGEWPRLSSLAKSVWETSPPEDVMQEVAPIAAAAEFHLRDWDSMGVFLDSLGSRYTSYEGCFQSALLAIHRERYEDAAYLIARARAVLDPELTALIGESYTRAYRSLVKVQQITELEEIIKYKTTESSSIQADMREMWGSRLNGCNYSVNVWQAALEVRSVVMRPTENLALWLRFSSLCRQSSRVDLAVKTLEQLHRDDPVAAKAPKVVIAYQKCRYAAGKKAEALTALQKFVKDAAKGALVVESPLLARCHLKLGLWTREIYEQKSRLPYLGDAKVVAEMLSWFESAMNHNSTYYKAWNAWALTNFQVVEAMEADWLRKVAASREAPSPSSPRSHARLSETRRPHVISAVKGFVQSVLLAKKTALQDILRLLTLWFKFLGEPGLKEALNKGFEEIQLPVWLQVLPQLLARLGSASPQLTESIQALLSRMAKEYPQAVVFPLNVAAKSPILTMQKTAKALLQGMQDQGHANIVKQTDIVSSELIRISVLLQEQWLETLEEASRLYHVEGDPEGMVKVLTPLHEELASFQPLTMREVAFQHGFNRDLQEAYGLICRFKHSGDRQDIEQAWQCYRKVFQKLSKQVQGISNLDLQSVSPALLRLGPVEIAVPGTYSPENGPQQQLTTIRNFSASIQVLASRQRPRILQVTGSDGRSYQFLLKGREDLKQDERVMQLFGLINNLFEENKESAKRDLHIARFAVVPLSTNSGLIEWVQRCDTLHQLIKTYRESRGMQLNMEYQLMKSICSRCDELSLLQKVEVFRYALENTSGMDLQQVLWLQSSNSEVWLTRRTTFCRSLAVMSVVGYILGLGDRHPSNLMIARETGQVVHIDFGDCFEVAAMREKFPERIPFRMTRMLLNALEVCGVEGHCRYTCELAMSMLRSNKDALMAMLEAFVFDPLITWRLLPAGPPENVAAGRDQNQPFELFAAISPLQSHFEEAAAQHGPHGADIRRAVAAHLAQTAAQSPVANQRARAGSDESARPAAISDDAGAEPLHAGHADDAELDPHFASVKGRQARRSVLEEAVGPEGVKADAGLLSSTARSVISRVGKKLTGTDFGRPALDVEAQVERLLQEATSHENLCQLYVGWCPFW